MTVTYKEFVNWMFEHEEEIGARAIGLASAAIEGSFETAQTSRFRLLETARLRAVIEGSFETAQGFVERSWHVSDEQFMYYHTDGIPETPEELAVQIAEVMDYHEHDARLAGAEGEADVLRDSAATLRRVAGEQ